jgi:hypothetical protein
VPDIVPVISVTLLGNVTAVLLAGIVKLTVLDVADPVENCTIGSSAAPTPPDKKLRVSVPGIGCEVGVDTISVISGCWVGLTAVGTVLANPNVPNAVETTEI